MKLRSDIEKIISAVLRDADPKAATERAVENLDLSGSVKLVAIGKAAWDMAFAAAEALGSRLSEGIVITKHRHSRGDIERLRIFEAGHPVPDESSFSATREAVEFAKGLTEEDTLLFLVSGGGSALFELPLVEEKELQEITSHLLRSGADITEINTVRKRLSAVKGGRFAALASPAKVINIVLSDVLGDDLSAIASGPCYPDLSPADAAIKVAEKYALPLSEEARVRLSETLPGIDTPESHIIGSADTLKSSAEKICSELGYNTQLLPGYLTCEAREAAKILTDAIKTAPCGTAIIAAGETVVKVSGSGLGGRNQELALAAAGMIDGCSNISLLSLGSDGTDGPTDAAGGMVFGGTAEKLRALGIDIAAVLADNDSYHALKAAGALLVTGPTGTNINDLMLALKA